MSEDPGPFQFGRNPENAMICGLVSLGCWLFSCCVGGGLSWLGLSFVACPFMLISIVTGILGVVWGHAALAQIETGDLAEVLAGRAKTGYWTALISLGLWVLGILLGLVMILLLFVLGIGAGLAGSL